MKASKSAHQNPEVGEILFSAEQIETRVKELGAEITRDYKDKNPLLVGVLKGSFIFLSDIARAIDLPLDFDFMAVSSYGQSTKTSGIVRIIKDLENDIGGKDVILVEDIIDSGLTFGYLYNLLQNRKPKSLAVCSLLLSSSSTHIPDYYGFQMPGEEPVFVVGYGLDASQKYRELPDIHRYIEQ